MRKLRIALPALLCVLAAVIAAIANARWLRHPENPTGQIPRTWDEQALATLEVPLAEASASPVPVSADYYYRIPVRPIYKTYPVYHPGKEPSRYFERLKDLDPEVISFDVSTLRTETDWIRFTSTSRRYASLTSAVGWSVWSARSCFM